MDEDNFVSAIKGGSFCVLVKANAKRTELLKFDEEKKVWRIAVAAPREENKANQELVRFLTKMVKKPVRIKSGLTSKQKVIQIG